MTDEKFEPVPWPHGRPRESFGPIPLIVDGFRTASISVLPTPDPARDWLFGLTVQVLLDTARAEESGLPCWCDPAPAWKSGVFSHHPETCEQRRRFIAALSEALDR